MLKKLVVASAVLALTTGVALASGAPYVGASIGEATNTTNSTTTNGTTEQSLNFRGIPFTVNTGYGALLSQNLYLGGEIFGTLGTATLNDNGIKSTYGYGVSILPGIMLSEHTLTYVRLGVVRSRFTPSNSTTGATYTNRNVNGGQLGIGMQVGLTQNVDLRGEYVYTAYQSFSGISKPRQDQFNLGLIYKFD